MQYLRDLLHDIRMTRNYWRYIRSHLRAGGNPDLEPF